MWRMERANGLSSHGLIIPCADGAIFAWFLNGQPLGYRRCDDLSGALRASEQMQFQNWAIGWRLSSDDRDDWHAAGRPPPQA